MPKKPTTDGDKAKLFASLRELRKDRLVPFTYGPLYVYGQVPFSILDRFAEEENVKPELIFFDFPFEIVRLPARLPDGRKSPYPYRLFAIVDTVYEAFCNYMRTVEIAHRDIKYLAMPRRVTAALLDPFMRVLEVSVPAPEVIDVWTVSTTKGLAVPTTHIEMLPYPIFKPGEAETLAREEFLRRLPRPATAPLVIEFRRQQAEPHVIVRGKELFQEL